MGYFSLQCGLGLGSRFTLLPPWTREGLVLCPASPRCCLMASVWRWSREGQGWEQARAQPGCALRRGAHLGLARQARVGRVHVMQHPLLHHLQLLLPVQVVLLWMPAARHQDHAATPKSCGTQEAAVNSMATRGGPTRVLVPFQPECDPALSPLGGNTSPDPQSHG